MTAATVDIRDVQAQWAELLQLVLAGNEVLLTRLYPNSAEGVEDKEKVV